MTVTTTYQRDILRGAVPVLTLGGPPALPDALGLPNGGYALAYVIENGGSTFAQVAFHDATPFLFNQALPQYGSDWTQPSSITSSAPITRLANGNFLAVWDNNDPGEGLTGRLFTPAGGPIGTPFILIGDAVSNPSDVQVATLGNIGFAISYTWFGNVWCARYDNAGTFLGTTLVNTAATTGTQTDAAIATLADGGFVVTYTDTNPSDQALRATVFNADGSVRKADFLLDGTGDNTQSKVVALPNGNWAVAYTDSGLAGEGGSTGIALQIFDATGANVTPGSLIHVNAPSSGAEALPDIAVLSNGFIAVTWTRGAGVIDDVYGRIFDQNGNAIDMIGIGSGEFAIAPGGGTTTNSAVAGLNGGVFVTAWDHGPSGVVDSMVSELARLSNGDDANDVIVSDSLRDYFLGGGGDDTAVFSQTLDKYTLTDFGKYIVVSGPDGTDVLANVEHLQFADGSIHVNDGNALFDTVYYMTHNLDVFHAGVNALDHYNTFGRHEGRDPNAFFDTSLYLAVNKDVAAAGVNPLDHYHQHGWREGRDPSAAFDTQLYLRHTDVAAAGVDPLEHYLQHGMAEFRTIVPAIGPITAGGFDALYYLAHNPDVEAAGVDPLQHYNQFGWHEGRNPNGLLSFVLFDTAGYLSHYPDVAAAGVNPLEHYNQFGWKEGRDPSAIFDTASYLAFNPDVAAAGVNPLEHYLQHGIYEGRVFLSDGMWG